MRVWSHQLLEVAAVDGYGDTADVGCTGAARHHAAAATRVCDVSTSMTAAQKSTRRCG